MERSFIAREQVCGSGVGEAGGEEGDRSLEGDAVPVVVGSGFDGGADDVGSKRRGGKSVESAQDGAREDGREDVARAVRGARETRVEVVADRRAVRDGGAEQRGVERDARERDVLRAERVESRYGVLDEGFVVALQDRLASEEEGGFGEIGENPVRAVAELRHFRGEVVAEAGVELAAVRHHGVDDPDRAGGGAVLHDREDRGDLRFADVAGVEGVEVICLFDLTALS